MYIRMIAIDWSSTFFVWPRPTVYLRKPISGSSRQQTWELTLRELTRGSQTHRTSSCRVKYYVTVICARYNVSALVPWVWDPGPVSFFLRWTISHRVLQRSLSWTRWPLFVRYLGSMSCSEALLFLCPTIPYRSLTSPSVLPLAFYPSLLFSRSLSL